MFNDLVTPMLLGGMITLFIWMQFLSHKSLKPDDGGRKKYLHPDPPKDMLFDIPPYGSVVFGSHKTGFKTYYICKPVQFEGAILVSGGSGCGKSTTIVEPYLLNCNKFMRYKYGHKKRRFHAS